MTVKAEHLLDKSTWLDGPWRAEPDRIEWVDEGACLPCLVLRNPEMGTLCGYVGVPPGHRAWGKPYSDLHQVEVHGGLTYHGPGEGEGNRVVEGYADYWYFGYDTLHHGDKYGFSMPFTLLLDLHNLKYGEYRDATYCMKECRRLASQLIEIDRGTKLAAPRE